MKTLKTKKTAGTAEKPVRILIVDDHFVVRQGLTLILRERYPEAVFGEAANAQEALDLAWKQEWEVVLLDISMPGRGGLEVLKELRKTRPKTPVIVLSMHSEEQFAVRVLKLGAASYVRKDSAGNDLLLAMEAALRGGRYITPATAEKLAEHVGTDTERPGHEALSDREYQVMCMLAAGKTVKEVGAELSLSIKTISTYRTRILEKMRLRNNAEIMSYALRLGLIQV
ncbi:MAG: response regulator transcription factor [Chthoniobacteraceae bacterium]